jgi:predicted phosphodiesterase
VRAVAEQGIPTIHGNYGYAIARDPDDCGCAYVTPHDRELGRQSVAWTLEHTDQASEDFMRELPFDLHFDVGGVPAHFGHGSPRKVNEYLVYDKLARPCQRLAGAETDGVLVVGHTHKPWVHDDAGVRFVNCGSVGKPKDADPRCARAVLTPDGDTVTATIERVELRRRCRGRRGPRRRPAQPVRGQAAGRRVSAPLRRRLLAEFLGSAFLAALVIGFGIAAQ